MLLMSVAAADPPPWAPAKGWRKKHDAHYYTGYSDRRWDRDYGITGGRCNTEEVLTAVGAIAGGVIGNRVARPENRTIATVVGATIGAVVGNRIGDRIDDRDRACVGHSLELARTGQSVRWVNPSSKVGYVVTPVRERNDRCREFDLAVSQEGRGGKPVRVVGCADAAGVWSLT